MPTAKITSTTGPIELYYEETGQGFPLIWCHEYGGDFRSWEPQVRYFSRRYRVVTWNYRGYPPSEVPKEPGAYSVESLVDDLRGLMRHLNIPRAHVGWALMMRGVQMKRKTIFELEPELKTLTAPSLIVVGDQDEPCLEPGLFMKRHIPHAGLVVMPMTGHTANIEEPALFNQVVGEFLTSVESGRWGTWKAGAR